MNGGTPVGRQEAVPDERGDTRTTGARLAGPGSVVAAGLVGAVVLASGLAAARFALTARPLPPWVELAVYMIIAAAAVASVWAAGRQARPAPAGSPMPAPPPSSANRATLDRFQVELKDGTRLIGADEIRWIEAAGNYARLHTADGAFLYRLPLARLVERLDARFIRVHRSSIVNLDAVRRVDRHPSGDADLHLDPGQTLRLSRRYARAFHERTGRP